jgi:TusA-related sulfurtransferase
MTGERLRTLDAFDISGLSPVTILDATSGETAAAVLLALRRALANISPGECVEVRAGAPGLRIDLIDWCRLYGNDFVAAVDAANHSKFFIRKGGQHALGDQSEWGVRLPRKGDGTLDVRAWLVGRRAEVPESVPVYYGFVPRGATAGVGLPEYSFSLNHKADVWAESITDLYEQATAQQWNAENDIPWDLLPSLPDDIERAVCQVMTFLAENEYAALYIPAKFLPRINAQYIEVVLFLSTVICDEARHIEAFTKRAIANGGGLQQASALTEWSLHSLLLEENYFRASFLLHVLGEGTFLELLEFIERHAPDPVTSEIVRRARLDEGRHVAYGIAHAREQIAADPDRMRELFAATEARAAAMQATSLTNPVLLEALATLAGGGSSPSQMENGLVEVSRLQNAMDEGRVRRLVQIGFTNPKAQELSRLHTPNFM